MAILSIQSRVISGYVGNAAAAPVLQRMGHTVWPVDTVVFSNHPAHGAYRGGVRSVAELGALIDGLDARQLFSQCDAVLSGYLGSAETGPVAMDAATRVRRANPQAVWLCDPVIGDNGAVYVAEGIAEFFHETAIAEADIVTPNAFEAGLLAGMAVASLRDAAAAAHRILAAGPRIVAVTGIDQGDRIASIVTTDAGSWRVEVPAVAAPAQGAGDIFAALFLGHYLDCGDAATSLARAVSGVHAVLEATAASGAAELALIPALDAAVDPPSGTVAPQPMS